MVAQLVCWLMVAAVSQQQSISLQSPFGPENRLVSPDGKYALFGSGETSQLWLEDNRTHQRRIVIKATVQTLTLAWSPDSAAFVVNDRDASDRETAYLYDVITLDRVDLRSRILAADPEAARFVPSQNTAPHSYFHAIRWLDARRVEVQLHGHTDGIWNGRSVTPGSCFDLRYRVSKDGAVQKLSQRVSSLSDRRGCAGE